ncbi:MAG: hypothetical protein H7281_02640 [Bacteriovorax sp.]|nr:hypothetical protein [Bacteriovorax sp.]
MKKNNLLKVALFMSLCSTSAQAYKISVYTDQPDQSKAQEVINTFKNTYPFNQYDIEYEVKSVQASQLNCKADAAIARLPECDTHAIVLDAAQRGVSQAIIVKDNPIYGGSGGAIPVVTTGSPASVAVHEYMHTLGLSDEYQYSASEAVIYCKSVSSPNLAFIEPNPNGYQNDSSARSQHMGHIPWGEFIKSETPITHSGGTLLGTDGVNHDMYATPNSTGAPSRMGSSVGLYEGKTCKSAVPPLKTWQPGREASIMEFVAAGLGAGNEMSIAKALESRGVRRKTPLPENTSSAINTEARGNKAIQNEDNSKSTGTNTISR